MAPNSTARSQAKERRRTALFREAARIIAERGFHQTRLADVGAAVGISGPGVYRYFSSKDDMLAQLLIDISSRLVARGREVMAEHGTESDPRAVLTALVAAQTHIAATEPDLIRVQEREIRNLVDEDLSRVKSLQMAYLHIWVEVLQRCRPELDYERARLRVQLAAGLINSSRHVYHWAGGELIREQSTPMAVAAMLAEADDHDSYGDS